MTDHDGKPWQILKNFNSTCTITQYIYAIPELGIKYELKWNLNFIFFRFFEQKWVDI